jgi:M3 family oligoendopeptidase
MIAFADIPYARPDLEDFKRSFRNALGRLTEGKSATAQDEAIAEINGLRIGFDSLLNLVSIRHTIDTRDAFYNAEQDFMDEAGPIVEGLESEFFAAIVASPFRAALEASWGAQLFRLAELKMRCFSPEVLEDLQAENRLISEYDALKAGAEIEFAGEKRNLAQVAAFAESKDRDERKAATRAVSGFYAANAEGFERIYDKLVRLRHGIARKLGFANFTELAYARLGRSDYGATEVAAYRDQVLAEVVPVAAGLRKRQAERLGLDGLEFCDESLEFLSGNATPKGDAAWLLEQGKRLYGDLSPETAEFFSMMTERGLLDLETKPGKASGGYCEYLGSWEAPFIFSNWNGTSGDVDVLTHEVGHAFQAWRSRGFRAPDYFFPTYEACEIHSMSMEFLAWPWMDRIFGEDEAKYKLSHLSAGILFVPYGVAVDEFQHRVYERPEASPSERRAMWREVERKYLPWRDYGDDGFLASGAFWFRQGHIFQDPFYYIDYTLAQVCAWDFWRRSLADREATFKAYLALCDLGGSRNFTELCRASGLRVPFEKGALRDIMQPLRDWLAAADDRGF